MLPSWNVLNSSYVYIFHKGTAKQPSIFYWIAFRCYHLCEIITKFFPICKGDISTKYIFKSEWKKMKCIRSGLSSCNTQDQKSCVGSIHIILLRPLLPHLRHSSYSLHLKSTSITLLPWTSDLSLLPRRFDYNVFDGLYSLTIVNGLIETLPIRLKFSNRKYSSQYSSFSSLFSFKIDKVCINES